MKNCEYDLNKILPSSINRKSKKNDEGHFYDELRLSPSPCIISGGQSGVDSVALLAASFLGLPAFSIMPENERREGESIEEFQRKTKSIFRRIQLASESYRFRTYANVYFSDVTVIYDFLGKSEGTLATLDACKELNRPFLLLSDTGENEANLLYDFLMNYSPDVINFAGNSLSKIDVQIQETVYNNILKALRKYCFCSKNTFEGMLSVNDNLSDKLTIAIPNFLVAKNIFKDFLRVAYGIDLEYSASLVYDLPDLRLVTVRPREILNLLKCGVDVGFVGEDLYLESGSEENIIVDTGLIPNNTVLVSKKTKTLQGARICSQYPVLARMLLEGENIDCISGSAEAYLNLGFYDFCVDSYQMGNTVSQNNLSINRVLKTTSLLMLGREQIVNTEFFRRFINYFCEF